MIKSQVLEDPCSSGTVPAGIDAARFEDDEHGYPGMNTGIRKIASRSGSLHPCSSPYLIRVHPCFSCVIEAGIDAARLEEDEHGYPGMNTG
jgi:hypothetical protein